MKKIYIILLILIIINYDKSYALSNNFKELISIMGIEKYNSQGYEINEYIYYKYNQIVYGEPEDAKYELTQRWKATEDGKWIRNGEKGEYRILGYNNIGKVVNNHDFPMDIVPKTEPTEWTYATLTDAEESWSDISRFKFVEQKQYMQNTNLMRNDIIYNITASDIGLDKARLDNSSTWKTKGLIYTNRIDPYGQRWEATFVTSPIGDNVSFTNRVKTTSNIYSMAKYQTSVDIQVEYSATLKGDLQYVKPEHVKKIESSIYINGKLLGTITSSKTLSHSGKKSFTIYHEDLIPGEEKAIIDIRSKLYTEFTTDGPMYAKNSSSTSIVVARYLPSHFVDREILDESEYQEPNFSIPKDNVEVEEVDKGSVDIEVVKIIKDEDKIVAQELNKSISTQNVDSKGFVTGGSYIGIKVKGDERIFSVILRIKGDKSIKTFDSLTKTFEWDEPLKLGNDTLFSNLDNYIELYSKDIEMIKVKEGMFETKYLVPYMTKQTLHSWNSLRDSGYSAFNINKNLILSRIETPYILEFDIYRQIQEETENGVNIYTEKETVQAYLDIFECWTNLYNRNLNPYILNLDKQEVEYEKWKNI